MLGVLTIRDDSGRGNEALCRDSSYFERSKVVVEISVAGFEEQKWRRTLNGKY